MEIREKSLMAALKSWIALLIILFFSQSAAAVTCGNIITAPATLTQNLTCQGNGLTITGAKLDCAGHTIKGAGLGAGIAVNGFQPILSNCTLINFDTGLVLNNTREATIRESTMSNNNIGLAASRDTATKIESLRIESNSIGMYLDYSSIDLESASFSKNINDVLVSPAQIGKTQQTGKTQPTASTQRPIDTPAARLESEQAEIVRIMLKEPTKEILKLAKTAPWQATAGLYAVAAGKKATIYQNRTRIDITIRPQIDTRSLKIIEYLPKDIAPSSKAITSSAPKFEVVDEDLTIMFRLGDIKAGTEKNITYTIDHKLARDMTAWPFTIISIVEEISPELENAVAVMSVLFAGMLAYYQYLRSKAGKDSNLALYTSLYIIALACTTILGYIQTTLELPPRPTAYLLAAALLGAIGLVLWETHVVRKELAQKPKKKRKRNEES